MCVCMCVCVCVYVCVCSWSHHDVLCVDESLSTCLCFYTCKKLLGQYLHQLLNYGMKIARGHRQELLECALSEAA